MFLQPFHTFRIDCICSGVDGSRQVTAKVDATGTGNSFVAATVTTNGDKVRSFTAFVRLGSVVS